MATSTKTKLPPNPFLHEVLALASKKRSNAEKVKVLQEYASDSLKAILIWNFDDTALSVLPEGQVPYKPNEVPVGTDHTSSVVSGKTFTAVKGGNDSLSQTRRETMFIQLLEDSS